MGKQDRKWRERAVHNSPTIFVSRCALVFEEGTSARLLLLVGVAIHLPVGIPG